MKNAAQRQSWIEWLDGAVRESLTSDSPRPTLCPPRRQHKSILCCTAANASAQMTGLSAYSFQQLSATPNDMLRRSVAAPRQSERQGSSEVDLRAQLEHFRVDLQIAFEHAVVFVAVSADVVGLEFEVFAEIPV